MNTEFRAKDKRGFWQYGCYFSSYGTHYIRTFNSIPPTLAEPGGDYQEIDYEVDFDTLGLHLDVKITGNSDTLKAFHGDVVRYMGKRYNLYYAGWQWELNHIDGNDSLIVVDEDVAFLMEVIENKYDK
jgi:hypothetical protein